MSVTLNTVSRISDCITQTLSQSKLSKENNQYQISKDDLVTWDACPICESHDHTRISDVSLNGELVFFSTDICNICFHIFRKVSPNLKWFTDRWKQISTGEIAVYNAQLEEKRRVRYELYYGLLHSYKRSGRLLDVGAAYGSGTKVFISRGFDADALEPEDDRAAYIEKMLKIKCYNTTLESLSPEKKYDLILFSHCLEHLNDPSYALNKLKGLLSSDGIIYLEVPIVWNVVDWQDSFFMAHKHNFTERNLKKLIDKEGLSVLSSFLIPDNDGAFCNLGLVLSGSLKTMPHVGDQCNLIDPSQYSMNDLVNLYKINLPESLSKNSLHFETKHIDNFYHIVKGDKMALINDKILK